MTGEKKLEQKNTSISMVKHVDKSYYGLALLLQEVEILAGHHGIFKDWQRM